MSHARERCKRCDLAVLLDGDGLCQDCWSIANDEGALLGIELRTAYEVCSRCCGHGLQDGMNGPVACSECHGNCTVRTRDESGRFTTVPVL